MNAENCCFTANWRTTGGRRHECALCGKIGRFCDLSATFLIATQVWVCDGSAILTIALTPVIAAAFASENMYYENGRVSCRKCEIERNERCEHGKAKSVDVCVRQYSRRSLSSRRPRRWISNWWLRRNYRRARIHRQRFQRRIRLNFSRRQTKYAQNTYYVEISQIVFFFLSFFRSQFVARFRNHSRHWHHNG